ncbi:four helix bundle protein [Limibacterium fermenti]|uniref:four helix bundle protein n=1 Tax=Limibacterium fermenti TaxID=3229863 RepID=UPI003A79044C
MNYRAMEAKNNILRERTFAFAIRCINLYRYLVEEKKEFVISKQMLRAGTSIGANYREAQNAESTNDFIHKLGIAQKECDETMYWLEILQAAYLLDQNTFDSIYKDASEILKMIKSSILTTKQKQA